MASSLARNAVVGLAATLVVTAGVLVAADSLPMIDKTASKKPAAFAFTEPLAIDEDHRTGEPNLRIDLKGRLYVGAPCGFVGCNQGWFWRSMDGGASWQFVSHVDVDGDLQDNREWRASVAPGGGDSDIAVTPNGRIYYADLYLAEISVSSSDDAGLTWTRSHPAVSNLPGVDRQWISVFGENMVYVAFNHLAYGPMVTKSIDGGLTWTTLPAVPPEFVVDWGPIGNLVTNQRDGRLALVFTACEGGSECFNDVWITTSDDGGVSWTARKVHDGEGTSAGIFAALAQDRSGNLYVTWTERDPDSGARSVSVASSTDWGASWSAPSLVSAGVENAVLPWLVAGSPGRVGVAFYGSDAEGDAESVDTSAEWRLHYAFSSNALAAKPTWQVALPSENPMHYGPICLGGLGCSGAGGDRSLLDFFHVQVDPKGMANVIYADNAELCPPDAPRPCPDPFVTFVKQTAGPSLYAPASSAPAPGAARASEAPGTVEWLASEETREGLLSGETAQRVAARAGGAAEEGAEEAREARDTVESARSPALAPASPARRAT